MRATEKGGSRGPKRGAREAQLGVWHVGQVGGSGAEGVQESEDGRRKEWCNVSRLGKARLSSQTDRAAVELGAGVAVETSVVNKSNTGRRAEERKRVEKVMATAGNEMQAGQ